MFPAPALLAHHTKIVNLRTAQGLIAPRIEVWRVTPNLLNLKLLPQPTRP